MVHHVSVRNVHLTSSCLTILITREESIICPQSTGFIHVYIVIPSIIICPQSTVFYTCIIPSIISEYFSNFLIHWAKVSTHRPQLHLYIYIVSRVQNKIRFHSKNQINVQQKHLCRCHFKEEGRPRREPSNLLPQPLPIQNTNK